MAVYAVDFDDSVFPLMKGLIRFLWEVKKMRKLHFEDATTYDLSVFTGIPLAKLRPLLAEFDDSNIPMDLKPIPGSYEALCRMMREGGDLVLITSRDRESRTFISKWLSVYMPGLFSGLYFAVNPYLPESQGQPKSAIAKSLGVSRMIEDATHHAREVANAGIPVILLDNPWNQDCEHSLVTRVRSWEYV